MKKATWKRHHQWVGLAMTFFIVWFCLSGIVLNHRSLVADVNVSRQWLPARYAYHNWNGGLLRGTLPLGDKVLLYGSGGFFLTDSTARSFTDFNMGLPAGADYRQIRQVTRVAGDSVHAHGVFAVSPFSLYRLGMHGVWKQVHLPLEDGDRLTDVTSQGDTLVVLSRSHAYLSLPPYQDFLRVTLPAPPDYRNDVTLFRAVWMLHSGQLFGRVGVLVVDAIALALLLLAITGLLYWLLPPYVKRRNRVGKRSAAWTTTLRHLLSWHDKTGRYTILLTLLLCVTGWCLRPPVMLPLVMNRMPVLPGTSLHGDNAWRDKLRTIRYDRRQHDWLLSTSEGFFSLSSLTATPQRLTDTPPVSVMGLNVFSQDSQGRWRCGSFSGLYVWDRQQHRSFDFFTHKPAPQTAGAPFGKRAVSGFSDDFKGRPCVVEYDAGTSAIPQPSSLSRLPMSLWNVALELHSGRLYIGALATYVFIPLAGALAVWCLWSGWKVRRKK